MTNREEFVASLREAADFFESHLDVPLPDNYFGIKMQASVETVAELRSAFHLSGPWEKEYVGETAQYKKWFGPRPANEYDKGCHFSYILSLPREQVCVKRKVGQEWVPPYHSYIPPTSGHYRDVYEWDCM